MRSLLHGVYTTDMGGQGQSSHVLFYQHLFCTACWSFPLELHRTELWNSPLLGEITLFRKMVQVHHWYSSLAARSLVPRQLS